MPQEIICHALNNENVRQKVCSTFPTRVCSSVCSHVCLFVCLYVCMSVRLLVCLFECCLRCLTCLKHKCNAFSCQKLRLGLRCSALLSVSPDCLPAWLPWGHVVARVSHRDSWQPVNKVDQTAAHSENPSL